MSIRFTPTGYISAFDLTVLVIHAEPEIPLDSCERYLILAEVKPLRYLENT